MKVFGNGRAYVPKPDPELTRRPSAGLPAVEMAINGSLSATERVLAVVPSLGEKATSGLSPIEWAQHGLKRAAEQVRRAVEG